jgi:hypothetical protein
MNPRPKNRMRNITTMEAAYIENEYFRSSQRSMLCFSTLRQCRQRSAKPTQYSKREIKNAVPFIWESPNIRRTKEEKKSGSKNRNNRIDIMPTAIG